MHRHPVCPELGERAFLGIPSLTSFGGKAFQLFNWQHCARAGIKIPKEILLF